MPFFRLLARLPFWFLYGFADVVFWLLAYVIRYRRSVIAENLARAFPEKSEIERRAIRRAFYRNLTDLLVETVKLPGLSAEELKRRVVFTNPEVAGQFLQRGQVVVGLASHQCNWEWLPPAAHLYGLPVDSVYKPLHNVFFEELMQMIRSTFGANPVPMQRLPREMVARKREPRIVALVADQVPDRPEFGYWTHFMHQDTPFYPGSERLARSQKLPVLFMEMVRVKRGYYTATFEVLAEPPYDHLPNGALIDRYRDRLEVAIQAQPANWLWSHRRWKRNREDYEGMGQERW